MGASQMSYSVATQRLRHRSGMASRTRVQPLFPADHFVAIPIAAGLLSFGGRSEPGVSRRSRKSAGAIPRREFALRDPWRANERCWCMPRWQAFDVGTTRGGSDRVRAAADFPPGGAGRQARAGWRWWVVAALCALRFRVPPVLPDSHVDREWGGQRGDPLHPLAHEFSG